jgi:hypothetical protein
MTSQSQDLMVMGSFVLVGRPLGDPLGAGAFLGAQSRGLWGSFTILPGLGGFYR